MPRRIIGQCDTVDFKDIEHLSFLASHGNVGFLENMTKKQTNAVRVIYYFQQCGVPFSLLLKVKEVLIWEMPDKGLAFEYKLADPKDYVTARILQTMKPKDKK